MKQSHATSHKPPNGGCMCIMTLLDGKCSISNCDRNHSSIGAERFKNSRSGANLTRVKSRPGFDIAALRYQKYTIIDLGPPKEPKRCFNCGGENHKQIACPQPKAVCALCNGQHKTSYCLEHAAWYMKEFPPLKKDFQRGRVAA